MGGRRRKHRILNAAAACLSVAAATPLTDGFAWRGESPRCERVRDPQAHAATGAENSRAISGSSAAPEQDLRIELVRSAFRTTQRTPHRATLSRHLPSGETISTVEPTVVDFIPPASFRVVETAFGLRRETLKIGTETWELTADGSRPGPGMPGLPLGRIDDLEDWTIRSVDDTQRDGVRLRTVVFALVLPSGEELFTRTITLDVDALRVVSDHDLSGMGETRTTYDYAVHIPPIERPDSTGDVDTTPVDGPLD